MRRTRRGPRATRDSGDAEILQYSSTSLRRSDLKTGSTLDAAEPIAEAWRGRSTPACHTLPTGRDSSGRASRCVLARRPRAAHLRRTAFHLRTARIPILAPGVRGRRGDRRCDETASVDEPSVRSTTRSRTTERIQSHPQSRSSRDAGYERMPRSLRAREPQQLSPDGCFPGPRSTSAPAANDQVSCRPTADLGPSPVPSVYLGG